MAQLPSMVSKIKEIADTGLYGSPKSAGFMDEVSKDYFTNVSSPVKAAAFAKFYKNYNKQKTPVYKPLPKLTVGSPLKKLMKKGKKKSPKEKSPDYKEIAKAAAKAKANYYVAMGKQGKSKSSSLK